MTSREDMALAFAEQKFGFLLKQGFRLQRSQEIREGTNRDWWELVYASPSVEVVLRYSDAQLEVIFTRFGVSASYLLIDRELFARHSGLHGNMFAGAKLAVAVERIAADLEANYRLILAGDEEPWRRIEAILRAPGPVVGLPTP